MRKLFQDIHDAVILTKGVPNYPAVSLVEIPGLDAVPRRVKYGELGHVIAGTAFNDDGKPVAQFLGYPCSQKSFEIVAVMRASDGNVLETVGGNATMEHLGNFAKRLNLGFNINYAI